MAEGDGRDCIARDKPGLTVFGAFGVAQGGVGFLGRVAVQIVLAEYLADIVRLRRRAVPGSWSEKGTGQIAENVDGLRVADNPGEAYDARSLREAGVDFQQRGLEGFVMLLKGEGFRPFVAPFRYTLGVKQHLPKNLAILVGCQEVAHPGEGHVVDIKAVFAAKPPLGLNGGVPGNGRFMGIEGPAVHFMVDSGDQRRLLFDVHVIADMNFNADGGGLGEGHVDFSSGIVHRAGDVYYFSPQTEGSHDRARVVRCNHVMIVQHHDAFAFQRVDRPERGLGVEGEFRGCPIAVASLEHLIHHGILAVVCVVDDVAFLEIAEFGARNSFDAEKFRLVELAGDERDHVGRDGVQQHGQDEGHHAVTHDDALG